jgi:drug/metabolite transporter (DMT)-like permease
VKALGSFRARLDPRRFSTEVLLLGTVAIWALNFTAVKYAITHGFSPLAFAAPRYALAGLVLGAFTLRRERSLRIRRRDLGLLAVAALVGISLNQLSFVYALHFASAATVALLFGTAPVLVALLAHFSGNERLARRSWFGAALSFAGVSLVVASGGGVSGSLVGFLLGLATAASWAVYSVIAVPLMRRYSTYRLNATVTLYGSLPLFLIAVPQLLHEHWSLIGPLAWIAFGYSLFAYVAGNIVWFTAIRRVGPSRAALFVNLEPFLAAVFAVFILSETLGLLQIAGGVVITVGIFVARSRRPQMPLAE